MSSSNKAMHIPAPTGRAAGTSPLPAAACRTDQELLHEFATAGSDIAFGQIVERHVNFVYSAALRQTGNCATAQDITQVVFTILARKAAGLRRETVLAGWLYRAVRYAVRDAIKIEVRRHRREQQAAAMQQADIADELETSWDEIAPLLDESLGKLAARDRDAVLLRYFENMDWRAVGAALGLKENAARVRVARALDKMRAFLVARGVLVSAAALSGALLRNPVQAAPSALVQLLRDGAALAARADVTGLMKPMLRRWHWRRVIRFAACAGLVLLMLGMAWFGAGQWRTARAAKLASAAQSVQDAIRAIDRAFMNNDSVGFVALMYFRNADDERFKPVLSRYIGAESLFRQEMGRAFKAHQQGFDVTFRELCLGQPPIQTSYIGLERAATNVMTGRYPLHLIKVGKAWKWDWFSGLPSGIRDQRLAALERKAQLLERIAREVQAGTSTDPAQILETFESAP